MITDDAASRCLMDVLFDCVRIAQSPILAIIRCNYSVGLRGSIMNRKILFASVAALALSVGAWALAAAPTMPPQDVPAATPMGSGPYRAIMEMEPDLPMHTVYHPADLAAAGRLPVVVW